MQFSTNSPPQIQIHTDFCSISFLAQFYGERFDWSEQLQGVILGVFYIGYVLTHIPGGLVAERIGGKMVFVVLVLIASLTTLITPICVRWGGASALIIIRIIMGGLQGCLWPAVTTIFSAWIPKKEKTFIASIAFSGIPVSFRSLCA